MLPYDSRLVKRKDFEKVYKFGRFTSTGSIRLKFLKNESQKTRLGIVVGIKFSKRAVLRNKVKRQIRDILRKNLAKIEKGFDIALSVRAEKIGQERLENKQLEKDLAESFQRAGLIKE